MRRKATARPSTARAAQAIAQPPADPRLLEGVALYNHHRFFECHEVLEQVWLHTTDRSPACPGGRGAGRKDFYKGLIQAAVACYHWSKGNRPGAVTLARSASTYLKRYGPVFLGLDVEQFLTQFSEVFGWLRRHRLRYDPRLVPLMRWTNARPMVPRLQPTRPRTRARTPSRRRR